MLRVKNRGEDRRRNSKSRSRRRSAALRSAQNDPYAQRAHARRQMFTCRNSTADLRALLASAELCSKRWIWQQYDYQVRTNTIAGPGHDAADSARSKKRAQVDRDVARWKRPVLLSRSARGDKAHRRGVLPQFVHSRRAPVADNEQPQLRQSGRPEIMAQIVESIEGSARLAAFSTPRSPAATSASYNETLGEPSVRLPSRHRRNADHRASHKGFAFKNVAAYSDPAPVDQVLPMCHEFGGTQYAKSNHGTGSGANHHSSIWSTRSECTRAYDRELVRDGGWSAIGARCRVTAGWRWRSI